MGHSSDTLEWYSPNKFREYVSNNKDIQKASGIFSNGPSNPLRQIGEVLKQ
jgi:hypothetical protein